MKLSLYDVILAPVVTEKSTRVSEHSQVVFKVKKDATSPAINPDKTNVLNGTYPLARPLFFYLRAKQTGEIKSFIDWVLSADGQAIVEKVGYYPVK